MTPSKSLSSRFPRPTPRLHGHGRIRRNSVQGSGASASESEDDSRRNTAITPTTPTRPETVTQIEKSNNTNVDNIQTTTVTPLNPICSETTIIQNEKPSLNADSSLNLSNVVVKTKRKMMVSESARKLAEARREFQLKHENKLPDRSQLRMYDFIHYNPTTNPMKKKTHNLNALRNAAQSPIVMPLDLPSEKNSDDSRNTAMPVPQVKVGPDGQLIIDEQSLVIENTGVKESRAAIQNQTVVIDDNDFGNGFYKRRKKTKEWPEWETIKFYKALNTVGTDFLLMQSLFPKRARQELKIKFKKEERVNRSLVEKALKFCQEFDIDLLKKELESFDNPEEIAMKQTAKIKTPKNAPKLSRKRKQASRRIAAMSICEEDVDEPDDADEPDELDESMKRTERIHTLRKQCKLEDVEKTNVESMDCGEADNESDSIISKISRSTRSGKLPKSTKISTYSRRSPRKVYKIKEDKIEVKDSTPVTENEPIQSNTPIEIENQSNNEIPIDVSSTLEHNENPVTDISSFEPGSLVIVSKESTDEPGKTVVQVYMVSTEVNSEDSSLIKRMTPVDVNPENLSMLTNQVSADTSTNKLFQDLTEP